MNIHEARENWNEEHLLTEMNKPQDTAESIMLVHV